MADDFKSNQDQASILVVDDDAALLKALGRTLKGAGYNVTMAPSAEEALSLLPGCAPELVISDLFLPAMDGIDLLKLIKSRSPGTEVVLITGHATIEKAVEAIRFGAYDFVEKPVERTVLIRTVSKALEKQSLTAENIQLRDRLAKKEGPSSLIGMSPRMEKIKKQVAQIAGSDLPVLITGASGTGKEVVADLIHSLSHRSKGPMIKISCAAIPDNLLESELFGYERGAFSGAIKGKQGRFELASSGTLFLDEIGDMAPNMQAKLLRVLQDGRLQRLGGTRDIHIDVRVVSATNLDIGKAISENRFREELYHRLNVIEIELPPLRERLVDLPLLVSHFIKLHASMRSVPLEGISAEALDVLSQHDWPGNVRELGNVVLRAMATAPGPLLEASDLSFAHVYRRADTVQSDSGVVRIPAGTALSEAEDILINDALQRSDGDREKAARLLGISSRTLYRRARRDLGETRSGEARTS